MPIDQDKLGELLGTFVTDLGATIAAGNIVVGHRLGPYRALADAPATADQLAQRTETDPRYVTEWLRGQAAGGYVHYDPDTEQFSLSDEQAYALAGPDGLCLPGAFMLALGALRAESQVTDAFRTGARMGWHEHHEDVFTGCEMFFRPGYVANLTSSWIPALDGVADKLAVGGRVADVGCGHGASTVLLAQAYPKARILGSDYHQASIDTARKRATDAGVADRARFEVASAQTFSGTGYDLSRTWPRWPPRSGAGPMTSDSPRWRSGCGSSRQVPGPLAAAAAGWPALAARSPLLSGLARHVHDDPEVLTARLRRLPGTFVHGDWKMGNLGRHPDGQTILLDWTLPGAGPACWDLCWYLALNQARLPEPKEAVIAHGPVAALRHDRPGSASHPDLPGGVPVQPGGRDPATARPSQRHRHRRGVRRLSQGRATSDCPADDGPRPSSNRHPRRITTLNKANDKHHTARSARASRLTDLVRRPLLVGTDGWVGGL
jgi:SAM-dependent methyltransferase